MSNPQTKIDGYLIEIQHEANQRRACYVSKNKRSSSLESLLKPGSFIKNPILLSVKSKSTIDKFKEWAKIYGC